MEHAMAMSADSAHITTLSADLESIMAVCKTQAHIRKTGNGAAGLFVECNAWGDLPNIMQAPVDSAQIIAMSSVSVPIIASS